MCLLKANMVAMKFMIILLAFAIGLISARSVENNAELKTLHDKALQILSKHPVVDGHNDFAWTVRDIYKNDLSDLNFDSNLTENPLFVDYSSCHTDLPKLREGHVGGQFWSAYAGCDTQYKDAIGLFIEQIDVIKRLVMDYPNDLQFVTDVAGLEQAMSDKKIGSMIGVESGHAIGNSLGVLRNLYDLGARYMTLTHMCNTPWADAAQAETYLPVRNDGLSQFGQEIIREMNRIGMLVDLAHVSSKTMSDVLYVARAPVIFSHSSARGVYDSVRNVPDDILLRVKENGGIVMVNFFSCYVTDCSEREATVEDVANHIHHIRNLIGADYIGIGSDFNGVPETPKGLENTSKFPNLFAVLLAQNWNEEDLGKLASGNILRVWKKVEEVRDILNIEDPKQYWIPTKDLKPHETECISDNY